MPELGIQRVKIKVDTGARTSALHAEGIEVFSRRGKRFVRFKAHRTQDSDVLGKAVECELLAERRVRSSNGHTEHRPVILTTVIVGPEAWSVELTLTTRDEMGFRMLLGRTALRRRFWVDAGRSYIQQDPETGGRVASKKAHPP